MFYRGKRALRRAWFNFSCRALLKTAPVNPSDGDLTIVSMICHGEVVMYILAVKSFCLQLGRVPQVVILNDGSLTSEDLSTILAHIPKAKLVSLFGISTGTCPKGSCWERLFLISDLVQNSYVVQLDSDTLTLGDISEIKQAIAANRSFTLMGDRSYSEIEPMTSACDRSKANLDPQVQAVCERSFDELPEAATLSYVRGNAGFTGFAKGSFAREKAEWFSDLMRRLAKEKWETWGSEQVTSNLIIANTADAQTLRFPKYLSYWAHPDVDYDNAAFIHFIGPHRYDNGFYLRKAKEVITTL
jgi:hypothetical protein